jgi:hypothetical protein
MSFVSYLSGFKWGDWFRMLISAGVSAAASVIAANPIASIVGAIQFTPRQLAIMAASVAAVAIANFLQKNPWPEREVSLALIPGVHTQEQVQILAKSTSPGTIPTKETAAAIIAEAKKEE